MCDHLTSRRGFLRGFGAAVSLPVLEAFRPLIAATEAARAVGTTASGAPLRMAYLYIPNGVNLTKLRPDGTSSGYKMGESFAAMEKHRKDFQIFTGFEQKNAINCGDGPGDHARGTAAFLTSARPRKTAGSDIKLGISADQVAANAVATHTRLPSLELSTDGVRKSGNCDPGIRVSAARLPRGAKVKPLVVDDAEELLARIQAETTRHAPEPERANRLKRLHDKVSK